MDTRTASNNRQNQGSARGVQAAKVPAEDSPLKMLGLSFTCILLGGWGIWSAWHEIATTHRFSVKLSFLCPLILAAGLVILLGMLIEKVKKANGAATIFLGLLMFVICLAGIVGCVLNPYLLYHYHP